MAAPTEFNDGKVEYETDGRSGDASEGESADFKFGPYEVSGVKRNFTADGFDQQKGFAPADKRGFSFLLAGGGDTKLRGTCTELGPKGKKGESVSTEGEPPLACACEVASVTVSELFVEDLAGEYNGPLTVGDVEARIVGGYILDNGDLLKGRPMGYRIEDSEGTVAAADTLPGEARVWLRKALEEPNRRHIACALAGLMLWVPPPSQAARED
jgi:hypothetical protein